MSKVYLVYVTLATKQFGRVKHWLVVSTIAFSKYGIDDVAITKLQILLSAMHLQTSSFSVTEILGSFKKY